MLGRRGTDLLEARRRLVLTSATKHPGSKRRARHTETGVKGNARRAMTRPVRRYPGWRKRFTAMARKQMEYEQMQERMRKAQRRSP